jgi:hypothetical protein
MMQVTRPTFSDLPLEVQALVGRHVPNPVVLESVCSPFRRNVAPQVYAQVIIDLVNDINCKEALQRFHCMPRSFTEVKRPIIGKIQSFIINHVPFFHSLPQSLQQKLSLSHISAKDIYRSLYKDLKALKASLKHDIHDKLLTKDSIGELMANPAKLADFLDGIYLEGIEQTLSVIAGASPTARALNVEISEAKRVSASQAVRLAFQQAKQLGSQIANELSGREVRFRRHFFDLAKTTWFADPTLYPHDFCVLLQSSTVRFQESIPSSHKPYCYCRFAPKNCTRDRRLTWV